MLTSCAVPGEVPIDTGVLVSSLMQKKSMFPGVPRLWLTRTKVEIRPVGAVLAVWPRNRRRGRYQVHGPA